MTSMGQRVDIEVQGFINNRLRFDQLVRSINEEERLLGVPFPAPKVNVRKVRDLPGRFCGDNQVSYTARYAGEPYRIEASVIRLRVDSDKCFDTLGSIAHEVAHTWFHGSDHAQWIDEGLANSIENQVKEAHPREAVLYPPVTYCASYRNISELELANPIRDGSVEASGFRCNYRLGDGIFGALREHLGTLEFNRRIATLARRAVNDTDGNLSLEDIREALGIDSKSSELIDLWYEGDPKMRIFRHQGQVVFSDHPTLDGEFLHFAGKTSQPGMVHELILGNDPYCSQFALFERLADPEYIASIADPMPVGWTHNTVPAIVVVNSEINPASGDFLITARVNDLSVLSAVNLSLQIVSRVSTGTNGKCEEDIHFSQVEIVRDVIQDEIKQIKHYHEDLIEWYQIPEVRNSGMRMVGKAPPGVLSFDDSEDYCSQFTLYSLDVEGYHYLATIAQLLPEGYHWTDAKAEITEAQVSSDGRFDALVEIWNKDLLSHDHLVLRVRAAPRFDGSTNRCEQARTLGAVSVER